MDILYLVVVLLGRVLNADVVHPTLALLRPWLRGRCRKSLANEGGHLLLLEFQGTLGRSWRLVASPRMFLGKHAKLLLSRKNLGRSYLCLQVLLLLFL